MTLVLTMLTLSLAVALGTRVTPTTESLRAAFEEAQRFYALEAYDQALEQYEKVTRITSRFLATEQVLVTVGEITTPVKEAALYQSGNAYFKMAEEVFRKARRADTEVERAEYTRQARAFLERAVSFFSRVESEAAVEALRALAQNRVRACWYEARDHERTVAVGRKLIEKYPDSPFVVNAMYDIAWSYFNHQDYEASIRAFKALIERFPKRYQADRALFQIGECHYLQGDYEKAVDYYQQVVDRTNIYALTERDLLQMRREKLAGLVDETALELAVKAQFKIGDCHLELERFDEAAEAYQRVVVLFSHERRFTEEAYRRLAELHYQKGDFDQAIQIYRDAIDKVRNPLFQAKMQSLLAKRYHDSGYFDEALREYELYIKAYDEVADRAGLPLAEAYYNMGRVYYDKGLEYVEEERVEEAREFFRQAIAQYRATMEAFPTTRLRVALLFNIALSQQFTGSEVSLNEALEGFDRIVQDYPDDPFAEGALFQIARIHYQRRDYTRSAERYEELVRRFPDSPQAPMAHFELGICRRDQGRADPALQEFLKVPATSPLFHNARLEVGELLIRKNAFDRAVQLLDEGLATAETPADRTRYAYLKGKAFMGREDYERAIQAFTEVIDRTTDPRLLESSLYARGNALLSLERYTEADWDLERLLNQTDNPRLQNGARRMLGKSRIRQHREWEAIESYEALAAQTTDLEEKADYLLLLAELYHGLEHYARVIEIGREIVELEIQDEMVQGNYYVKEKAFFLLGNAYNRREDYPSVVETYTESIRRYPHSTYLPHMVFFSGLASMLIAEEEAAASWFERFLDRHPDHPNVPYALYYLGYVRFNQTAFEQALEAFDRLVAQFPHNELVSDARFRSGECAFNLGQFQQALNAYLEVVERWPHSEQADEALYNGAWALLERERGEEAVAHFRRLLEAYPESPLCPNALFTIADNHYNEGQYKEALRTYEAFLEKYPDNELAAKIPEFIQDLKETVAFVEYQKAAKGFPEALAGQNRQALARFIPRLQEVLTAYQETESGIGALNNMGIAYESLNKWKEAVAVYDQVIARSKSEAVSPEAYRFAQQHRDWIVAYRL